jgi:hypothetical protein
MKFGNWPAGIVVTAFLLVAAVWIWTMNGSFVCVINDKPSDRFLKTIVALDGIADLGLKFSTSLVGFAAALLIGLKSGLSLTAPVRTSLVVSMLMFTSSALYAVWWRYGIAESWLNQCLNMVVEDDMKRRYVAHLGFFAAGLFSMGALVFFAALARREAPSPMGD